MKVLRPSDRARLIVVLWFRSLCYAKLTGCRLHINIDVTSRQQINKTEQWSRPTCAQVSFIPWKFSHQLHDIQCSVHIYISLLSELPDPFSRSRLNGLLQKTKKTADASEADQDQQNQQLQTLTVTVRKSLILIRWVWTDCCCNVFMFLLHLSCTGSDQPGHQNYGTLTWRFSISLFLPSGFSPQLHLRVHPRSSHRLCGYKISSALIFCVLNFSLFSSFHSLFFLSCDWLLIGLDVRASLCTRSERQYK